MLGKRHEPTMMGMTLHARRSADCSSEGSSMEAMKSDARKSALTSRTATSARAIAASIPPIQSSPALVAYRPIQSI